MNFTFHVLALTACLISSGCGSFLNTGQRPFALRPGDLLFQDLDGSPFYDAVEKVT